MNNNNYLGSSLFIIHLDFGSRPIRMTEDEKTIEMMQKNLSSLSQDSMKKLERIKKRVFKRKLSMVEDVALPEIK